MDRVAQHLQLEQRDGGYAAQNQVQQASRNSTMEDVYRNIATLIHAATSEEIALVESATVGWTRAFYALVQRDEQERKRRRRQRELGGAASEASNTQQQEDQHPNPKRVILISEAEYAANVVAVCQWARDHDEHWMVLAIPSSSSSSSSSSIMTNSNNSNQVDDISDNNNDNDTNSSKSTGIVDLQVLDRILAGKFTYINVDDGGKECYLDPTSIALVCITHIPTNSGIVNPVEEIGRRIANYNNNNNKNNQRRRQKQSMVSTNDKDGDSPDDDDDGSYQNSIKYLVDACQSVGQRDVNVQNIQCDSLVATGRKYLRGPRGTGFLYMSSKMLNEYNIMPAHIDHYGCPIRSVPQHSPFPSSLIPLNSNSYRRGMPLQQNTIIDYEPRRGAKRFEFWESSIASRLGLGEAVCYALDQGLDRIERDIRTLAVLFQQRLMETVPTAQIHHRDSTTCGIITFFYPSLCSQDAVSALVQDGFELSYVPATSTPLDSSTTNVPGLIRVSLSYTTTHYDIDTFCTALAVFVHDRR